MPALSERCENLLVGTIETLCQRMLYHTLKNTLTHAHLFEMFVAPEDRDAVFKAGKLFAHGRGGWFSTTLSNALGEFKVNIIANRMNEAFLHPHYMGKERFTDDTHPGNQALDQWVGTRYRLGCEFGLVRNVLEALNVRCKTASQMRFFWPGLATLAGQTAGLEAFADSLREANTPPDIPALEPALRDACRTTTLLLTKVSLLPKDTPHRGLPPVDLELDNKPHPKVPWNPAQTAFWY